MAYPNDGRCEAANGDKYKDEWYYDAADVDKYSTDWYCDCNRCGSRVHVVEIVNIAAVYYCPDCASRMEPEMVNSLLERDGHGGRFMKVVGIY